MLRTLLKNVLVKTVLARTVLAIIVLGSLALRTSADTVVLIAGTGAGADGGPAADAKLDLPFAVASDSAGNVYTVEMGGHRVRKVAVSGLISTVVGTGQKGFSGDGGPAVSAQIDTAHSIVAAPDGTLYIADTMNDRVRRIDPRSGVITTIAGTGAKGFAGDGGPAVAAQFGDIYCIALNTAADKLYITDLDNKRIRLLDLKTGVVSTVAGNGATGVPADGSDATKSPLVDPRAVGVDSTGNIYILERGGNALRVVDRFGKIRTVVGTGKAGPSVPSADGAAATLNSPKHIYIDSNDNVLIADTDNNVIRRYIAVTGKVVAVAGSGTRGDKGLGGPALELELNLPHGVYIQPTGLIYIADSFNNRILKLEP